MTIREEWEEFFHNRAALRFGRGAQPDDELHESLAWVFRSRHGFHRKNVVRYGADHPIS